MAIDSWMPRNLAAIAPAPSGNMTMVQALRGIAALWVVLFHVAEGHHIDTLLGYLPTFLVVPVFLWGHYGVAIFFALSGFVIAHSLRGAQVDAGFFGRFLLRRSIRLDPPYWGAIVICVALSIVSAKATHEPVSLPSAATVVAHPLYLQGMLGLSEINSVFWTLTYEVQFYAVLCASMMLWRWRAGKEISLALLFVLAVWSALGLTNSAPTGLFVNLWHAFFIGALAYWSLTRPLLRIPFLILLVSILLPLNGQDRAFGAISGGTAALLFGCGMTGALYRGLGGRGFQMLGLISYSLYLLHNPIGGATGFIVRKAIGNGLIANVVSLFAIVAASTIAAALYYYVVERTAHRWSRKVRLISQSRGEPSLSPMPS